MRTRLTILAVTAAVATIVADVSGCPAVFLAKPLALTLLFAATLAALGATAVVLSDGLLALNRFWAPLPAAAVLVLVPYYVAQFLLAASVGTAAGAGALVEAT